MRFGIAKSGMRFPFVSALAFRYLCKYEDRMRLGIAKSGMRFPFVSALAFRYLCKYEDTDAARHSQVGNAISVCLCAHLSLSL